MASPLSSHKVDEALRLTASARAFLLELGHSRSASVSSLLALQDALRAVLRCTALLHAYDQSSPRGSVYAHVGRTLSRVLELRPGAEERAETAAEERDLSPQRDERAEAVPLLRPESNAARWADVVGCDEAVSALRLATDLPRRFPRLFRPPRRAPRRLLLYGPPGTGKTLLAAAAAAEFGAPLLAAASADLLSKWVGESERRVRGVFAAAARLPRCVLFLDEVDALCAARGGGGESESARRVKTELLLRLHAAEADGLMVVAATNMPWELDAAFRRRFDRHVFVGLPNAAARERLLAAELRGARHALGGADMRLLAQRAEGYSAADIRLLAQCALMEPVRRVTQAAFLRPGGDGVFVPCAAEERGAVPLQSVPADGLHAPEVTREDFHEAFRIVAPTVTAEEMKRFEQWRNREGGGAAVSVTETTACA